MFGKKKETVQQDKPNLFKIEMAFESSLETVQEVLDKCEVEKEGYIKRIVQARKANDKDEEEFNKQRLVETLGRYHEMRDFYRQIDSFQKQISDMFTKMNVMENFGAVADEVSKMSMDTELKDLSKRISQFAGDFTNKVAQFNVTMSKIDKNIDKLDSVAAKKYDKVIESQINDEVKNIYKRIDDGEAETNNEVDEIMSSL